MYEHADRKPVKMSRASKSVRNCFSQAADNMHSAPEKTMGEIMRDIMEMPIPPLPTHPAPWRKQ